MNSKERFLTALKNQVPDRVPATPDISNMVPCRLTGRDFRDIYIRQDPPLWQAYIDAVNYFGIDAWFFYGGLDYDYPIKITEEHSVPPESDERTVHEKTLHTPDGDLTSGTTFYREDPPTHTEKPVKNLKADFSKLKHLLQVPATYSTETALAQKRALGPDHAFGIHLEFTGFQFWGCVFINGGVEALVYLHMDDPDILSELYDLHEKQILKKLEMALDSKLFDYVTLGGSGAITLASPDIFDTYAFPCIQKMTRLCKAAGVPTVLHSCGKETHIVKRCSQESDLNCVNPLEIPPMGDCVLADIKKQYGEKIALMGNLHTTNVMLKGTPQDVDRAARQAILDAKDGGGFILSTGDQCGRDTPDENIFALVEATKRYGVY